jgi:hypothetical protein
MLDKLKNKPIPKEKEIVEVVFGNFITDKTHTGFDATTFIKNIKKRDDIRYESRMENERKRGEIVPEIEEEIEYTKPKKTKRKMVILEEDSEKVPEVSKKVPEVPAKEPEEVSKKVPRLKKVKKLHPVLTHIEEIDHTRFKKVKNVDIRVPSYYMNNREAFIGFINKLFAPYREIIEKEENTITCENMGKNENKDLMIHQRIVRDYINLHTPYRGLLLYHGLGSGKTCTSIGVTEGLKNEKRVIIMTPASLRANYMSQLKECGDYMYKLNQFWEWFPSNSETDRELAAALSFPLEDIRKKGGAWLVNVTKKPNYQDLTEKEKESLNTQINKMIENKYIFINYNGLRLDKLREMTNNLRVNLFDNCVVIIDEAHNFISRIVNKLNKTKDTDLKDPDSLSLILYKFLLSCENSRIVLLTGTPMVNYPNEIGILFNILKGYIRTWNIQLETSSKLNREMLQEMLEINKQIDYFEYSASTKMLTVTRNPLGFENVYKKDNYVGVHEINEREVLTDDRFLDRIIQILKQRDINVKGKPKLEVFKCLPDTLDEFSKMFIENNKMKNDMLFKRRIIGMTSYFKSAQEELMPSYNSREDLHVIDIPMSDYQFETYEKARIQERKLEKNAKRKTDVFKESSSTYRIFSRLFCNYVMPQQIGRPLPNDPNEPVNVEIDMQADIPDIPVDMQVDSEDSDVEQGGAIRETKEGIIVAKETKEEKQRKKQLKEQEKQMKEQEKQRKLEEKQQKEKVKEQEKQRKLEEKQRKLEKQVEKQKEKRVGERKLETGKIEKQMQNIISNIEDNEIDESLENYGDATYEMRIRDAMQQLVEHADEYLSEKALEIYSPKYLEILKNIKNIHNEGLHLIYSQFRTLEGIGVFAEVLKANGYTEFKVIKTTTGWDINVDDFGKQTFALYTGTETTEEKEIIRKIYNGEWNKAGFPVNIAAKLNEISSNNNLGEIIKIFMITASGAEGINLHNTRFVHIMEPYWHPARTEQVIGRARRICSHQHLPLHLQTVEVFIYLMIFTESQIKTSKELRKMDLSKRGEPRQPVSSDYALYEINLIKTELSQEITRAIKESSIDCAIHPKNEDITCMNFSSSNDFLTLPSIHKEQNDKISKLNTKTVTWKPLKITINGKEYAYNKDTGVIFDYDMMTKGIKKRLGERIKVGKDYEIHWD